MTERSAIPTSFVIERRYEARPSRVFAAWAEPEARAHWFVGPAGWVQTARELDFRAGGSEILEGAFASGMKTAYRAHFFDIVPNQRVVYAYDVRLDGKRISVSLATVEFAPAGNGTRMLFGEQMVCLDGYQDPEGRGRQQGIGAHLDGMEALLAGQSVAR